MRDNFNTLQELLPKLAGQRKASNVSILKEATGEIKVRNEEFLFSLFHFSVKASGNESEKHVRGNVTLL